MLVKEEEQHDDFLDMVAFFVWVHGMPLTGLQ
jgi:hypothetical protein